ncbi:hypothetical protein GCK32_017514, partial [Trichostrongylus colubriformis]
MRQRHRKSAQKADIAAVNKMDPVKLREAFAKLANTPVTAATQDQDFPPAANKVQQEQRKYSDNKQEQKQQDKIRTGQQSPANKKTPSKEVEMKIREDPTAEYDEEK